jgi:hypothetical protein
MVDIQLVGVNIMNNDGKNRMVTNDQYYAEAWSFIPKGKVMIIRFQMNASVSIINSINNSENHIAIEES